MTIAPDASFASVDEAMDLVRSGLGYLARADVASLPAVTQARLLREFERAQSQHTAGRVRVLSAFTVQGAYADDGHGGPHPWLAWQTRVTARAASATIAASSLVSRGASRAIKDAADRGTAACRDARGAAPARRSDGAAERPSPG